MLVRLSIHSRTDRHLVANELLCSGFLVPVDPQLAGPFSEQAKYRIVAVRDCV